MAIYATKKAAQLGGKVVAMSDSTRWIYDEQGIDLMAVKKIKEVEYKRIKEYVNYRPLAYSSCWVRINAGGVITSALEMSQNSMCMHWMFEEVDAKLHDIMVNIFKNISNAAEQYGFAGNYVSGANIASFQKVADVMVAKGVC